MLRGGCLCGEIRYEIGAPLGPAILCHCSQCRRASGSAFAANASVRAEALTLTAGHHALAEIESSPGKTRTFCHHCGSPIYTTHTARPGVRRIRLGTLDPDATPIPPPVAHIWLASRAPWYAPPEADGLERFDEEPPAAYLAPG